MKNDVMIRIKRWQEGARMRLRSIIRQLSWIPVCVMLGLMAIAESAVAQPGRSVPIDDQPGVIPDARDEQLPAALQRQAVFYRTNEPPGTIIVDTALPGGYVATTHEVSNYPGFAGPQAGYMLSHNMSEQARRAGVRFRGAAEIEAVDLAAKTVQLAGGETISARWLVIASGSSPKKQGVPGEAEFRGKGISYCPNCAAKYYQDKDVAVIGGGNSAVEESLFISRFAKSVTIIHQFDRLSANREAQEKARSNPKINFLFEHEPRLFNRNGGSMIVEVEHLPTGGRKTLHPDGIFIFAGFSPSTAVLNGSLSYPHLSYDSGGYIKADEDMRANIPAVCAMGDIRSKKHRQITTAVADGTIAAIEITKESERSNT